MSTSNFPEELTKRKQWLVWRFVHKQGQKKPAKFPYYANGNMRGWPNGKPRDAVPTEYQPQVDQGHPIDRDHLVDFDTAMEAARLRKFDGVGFAFLPGDGLIGIDLDAACSDKHGSIRDACKTFAERSPSGTGLHIIGLGECETFKSNDVGIEVFCGRQFFTMTGNHDPASPNDLHTIPADTLAKLRRTVEQAKEAARGVREVNKPSHIPSIPNAASSPDASRYCLGALESAVQRLRSAPEGGRNDLLNGEAYGLAQLIHTGGISETTIRAALQEAAQACGLPRGEAKATINSGIRAGLQQSRQIPDRPQRQAYKQQRIDQETGEILTPPAANDNLSKPINIFAEFPAPSIERSMLPDAIANYATECGELIGVDPSMIAIPALVSCAAALHDDVKIQPKRYETGWTESARLWCAVVGLPSVRKSPAIRRATKRLRKIDVDLSEQNNRAAAEHAEQMEAYKEAKKEAKKTGASIPEPKAPPKNRMIVEDITVESLSDVLKDNSRGVLCIQDELSGWFGMMDAYTGNKSGGKDRAAWLQAYNGGFRQVDRVMRGSISIPNFSVSMIGGIQPDAIRRIAKHMTDDGLMQRFMIVIGRNALEHDRPENHAVYQEFSQLIDHLHAIQGSNDPVRLSEPAHQVRERLLSYSAELSEYQALPGGLRSHLGKWSGLFARLLLVYHAIQCSGNRVHPSQVEVSGETAEQVDQLMRRFLLPHALAYYTDILGVSSDLEHARWIAGHVLSKRLDVITNRDLVQAYKQWRGMEDWRRQRIMSVLEDMGWVLPIADDGRMTKRGITTWAINSLVHESYQLKAAEESERRDRIRAEIAALHRKA